MSNNPHRREKSPAVRQKTLKGQGEAIAYLSSIVASITKSRFNGITLVDIKVLNGEYKTIDYEQEEVIHIGVEDVSGNAENSPEVTEKIVQHIKNKSSEYMVNKRYGHIVAELTSVFGTVVKLKLKRIKQDKINERCE